MSDLTSRKPPPLRRVTRTFGSSLLARASAAAAVAVTAALAVALTVALTVAWPAVGMREVSPASLQVDTDVRARIRDDLRAGSGVCQLGRLRADGSVGRADSAAPGRSAAAHRLGQQGSGVDWERELRRLDRWRGKAWRRTDPVALLHVYTAPSAALRAERGMIEQYDSRGLRVIGVHLRFGAVSLLERTPRRAVLAVVDQLRRMRAHSVHDERMLLLPRDQPTRHRIVLRREAGRWLMSSVEAL